MQDLIISKTDLGEAETSTITSTNWMKKLFPANLAAD